MELATPAARYLGAADHDNLATMRCSKGMWYEDEVEAFIQTRLVDYHDWRQPHTDHTIIGLELDDVGLIAVGSHEEDFVRDRDELVKASYLECAAVALDYQGALLPDVEPIDPDGRPVTVGRYLLEVLLSDIAELERAPFVRAVVARDNIRSLRLCDRIGLVVAAFLAAFAIVVVIALALRAGWPLWAALGVSLLVFGSTVDATAALLALLLTWALALLARELYYADRWPFHLLR